MIQRKGIAVVGWPHNFLYMNYKHGIVGRLDKQDAAVHNLIRNETTRYKKSLFNNYKSAFINYIRRIKIFIT